MVVTSWLVSSSTRVYSYQGSRGAVILVMVDVVEGHQGDGETRRGSAGSLLLHGWTGNGA